MLSYRHGLAQHQVHVFPVDGGHRGGRALLGAAVLRALYAWFALPAVVGRGGAGWRLGHHLLKYLK